jgi:hypothetical protein
VGNELVLDVYHRDAICLVAKHRLNDTQSFIWQAYLKPEYNPPDTGSSSGGKGQSSKGQKSSSSSSEELKEWPKAHVAYTALGVRAM